MAELIELVKSKVRCSTERNTLKETKSLGKRRPFVFLAHGVRKETCGLNRKKSCLGRREQGMT